MIIPQSHIAKIQDPVFYCWIGTADATNVPDVVKCVGAKVSGDFTRLTCFVVASQAEQMQKNLLENSVMTLLITSAMTYEGYQYKGRVEKIRQCTQQEEVFLLEYREGFLRKMGELLPPTAYSVTSLTKVYFGVGYMAIEFSVNEIFEQTPKKGTGGKVTEI